MKWIWRAFLAVVALGVLIFAGIYVASESGEVVVLRSWDDQRIAHETRLWIVEADGFAWLRTGNPNSSWLGRVRANPEVEVTRAGETRPFRAVPVPDPEVRDRTNRLILEKYGWAERYLRASMLTPERATSVRLEPR
jgi:hypothetical protein